MTTVPHQNTLPIPEVDEHPDPIQVWQQEASLIFNRPAKPPPQFVPATLPYDGWIQKHAETPKPNDTSSNNSFGDSLSKWYRSLTSQTTTVARDTSADTIKASHTTLHTSSSSQEPIASPVPKPSIRLNKNNWFIMKAIQSEPPSSSVSIPAPTLAEILARDPLPSEGKFTPPVWIEIGPSNRGYGMLQRSGWNEGEPLGPNVLRRKPVKEVLPDDEIFTTTKSRDKGKGHLTSTSLSCQQSNKMDDALDDGMSELRNTEVIDLTLSDSDSEDSSMKVEDGELEYQDGFTDDIPTDHGGIALLTPIATRLKSDRLGIGLKAKTTGPYKASQKRVTHNAAALAAHIRAAEESRRRMREHGRGRRGHKRQRRKEEEERKAMLASLKS